MRLRSEALPQETKRFAWQHHMHTPAGPAPVSAPACRPLPPQVPRNHGQTSQTICIETRSQARRGASGVFMDGFLDSMIAHTHMLLATCDGIRLTLNFMRMASGIIDPAQLSRYVPGRQAVGQASSTRLPRRSILQWRETLPGDSRFSGIIQRPTSCEPWHHLHTDRRACFALGDKTRKHRNNGCQWA